MDHGRRNLIVCLLALVTLAVYGQTVGFGFVTYDDPHFIVDNEQVMLGLTWDGLVYALTTRDTAHWQPLTWLSHMFGCHLFGAAPAGHHAINLLLHVANTLLVFGVLRAMTGARWPSALVAALFSLHPLHVESVAWIAQRNDLLCAFFGLLAMWAYVWYCRRPAWGRYLTAALLFALGLLAMLVTLPFVLLLLDYWPLNRIRLGGSHSVAFPDRSLAAVIVEKIPLMVLSAASSVVTYVVMKDAGAIPDARQVPLSLRLANAVVSYVRYLEKTVWPTDLAVFYPHPNLPGGTPWRGWQIAGAAVLLAAISVLVVFMARRRRYMAVGWFWYLGMLVPGIGLIQAGEQAMADCFTYLPLMGLFILFAWGAAEVVNRVQSSVDLRPAAGVAASVLLVALAACSCLQLRHWSSSVALFEHAARVAPGSPTVHYTLGHAYFRSEQFDFALAEYTRAIELDPLLAVAYLQRGITYWQLGKSDPALAEYDRALELDPHLAAAYQHRGRAYEKLGRHDLAFADYSRAIELEPDDSLTYYARGIIYGNRGQSESAVADYSKAIDCDPDFGLAYYNRAHARHRLGQHELAVADLTKSIELTPNLAEAYYNRAVLYFQKQQYEKAWMDATMVQTLGSTLPPEFIRRLKQSWGPKPKAT